MLPQEVEGFAVSIVLADNEGDRLSLPFLRVEHLVDVDYELGDVSTINRSSTGSRKVSKKVRDLIDFGSSWFADRRKDSSLSCVSSS